MKALSGSAVGVAGASIEVCFEQLADVESYPSWYPEGVGPVVVRSRDVAGTPTTIDATLKIAVGPLSFDRPVPMSVGLTRPESIRLERVPDDTHDREQLQVLWRLRALAPAQTELSVEMRAHLDLPSFLPGLGSVAGDVARGFVNAAVAAFGR